MDARATKYHGEQFAVVITIDEQQSRRLGAFTSKYVGRNAELRSGNRVITAPRINEPITQTTFWLGGFFAESEAEKLAQELKGKELTLTIEP